MKLYIGNLSWSATENEVEAIFQPYGVLRGTCRVIRDRETGRSRGFGFIEVQKGDEAIADLNGKELTGRLMRLSKANAQ